MPQGTVIAGGAATSLSTTETANLIQNTYDYVGAGQLKLYAKASAATVLCNLFVNGVQILRRTPIMFTGTAGTIDTSANLITSVPTMGGRVELTFVATTGTPTIDYLLTFEGVPVVGRAISKLFGR
jgi:hypothetical protein